MADSVVTRLWTDNLSSIPNTDNAGTFPLCHHTETSSGAHPAS